MRTRSPGTAVMSAFAERLLEHPCVRHFLLAFDETEWPDVVQSSTVLGIQALICRYGSAKARLVDASCLRALARWVERQGYWPYTLALEMEADERPVSERPAPRFHERTLPRKPNQSRAQRISRTPRPGRPRRSGLSVPAGRRLLASSGRADHGVALLASPRVRRGRSAPPALGLADLVLPMRRPRAIGAPVVSARHVDEASAAIPGVPWTHRDPEQTADFRDLDGLASAPTLPRSERRPVDGDSSIIQRRQASAQIGSVQLETSEWYGRLMSRLQRLNEQLPSPGGAVAGKTMDVETAAVCRNCGNTGVDFAGNPCSCPYGQQHGEETSAAGIQTVRPSRNRSTDYLDYGASLHQERPLFAGGYRLARESRHARDSQPEYEHGSLLLSELPSREGRREWHAISRGPWSGTPRELVD